MRRAAHQLSRTLAWLLLFPCLVILVFWIRSYSAMDFYGRMTFVDSGGGPESVTVGVASGRGGIGYWNSDQQYPPGVDFKFFPASWLRFRDGKLRWRVLDNVQYPFMRLPARASDRFGFFDARINATAPPPWPLDGSRLRAWRSQDVVVPYWFLFLVTSVWPLVYFGLRILRKLKANRRKRQGLCAVCGYDLRASSEKCPECGAEIVHQLT